MESVFGVEEDTTKFVNSPSNGKIEMKHDEGDEQYTEDSPKEDVPQNISVFCRIRPLTDTEIQQEEGKTCVECDEESDKVIYLKVPNRKHAYQFDFEKVG